MAHGSGEAETERLRAQVSELQAQLAREGQRTAAADRPSRRRIGWRGPLSVLLVVIGCVLAPVSVVAVWGANQVSNTDRYVANVSPLISEPAVKNALTDKISTAISKQLNVQAAANSAASELSSKGFSRLSTLISNFSGSIASGVDGLIHNIVAKIIGSEAVARLWVNVNRAAHTQLDKALSGEASALSVNNGKVVINLGPLVDKVKHRLSERGLTLVSKLPTINPTFPLFSAKYLVKAQSFYRLLTTLKWVLPLVTLILLVAGIFVTRRHRRALVGAGLGLAASMLVLGIGLAVVRSVYLSSVPSSVLPADAAAVVFDTLVRFIKQGLRVVLAVGIVVALAGFFSGPSVTAVRTRDGFKAGFGWIRGTGERAGLTTGPVGTWVYRHRTVLRIAAVIVAALIFLFWSNPTGLVVLLIAIVLLVAIGLIELIGRPPLRPRPAGPPDGGRGT